MAFSHWNGVTFDKAGNLYGSASGGGRGKSICQEGCGLVFELSPSGGTWEETILVEFDGVVGAYPNSPVSIDELGNLYGTFTGKGALEPCYPTGSCGGVYKIVPVSKRKYVFDLASPMNASDPESGVAIGSGNVLYGTEGIADAGQVYMLQGTQETILYNFCSLANCADGLIPTPGTIVIHWQRVVVRCNNSGRCLLTGWRRRGRRLQHHKVRSKSSVVVETY